MCFMDSCEVKEAKIARANVCEVKNAEANKCENV